MEYLKIGNTSFSPDLVEMLKGKSVEEILVMRPGMHHRIAEEFVKIYPVAKKPRKKKNEPKDEETEY